MPIYSGRMATMPPEQSPPLENAPHRHRQVAESFGTDAERYDRARPRYPDALVERVIAASPGPDILDVGCGTGIAARQFQAAGGTVLGVEPDARMAGLARRFGLPVEVAKFEDWDPARRTFDAIVAAQSWHWIDPIDGAAKAARVLRPGGLLAVFWNVFVPPQALGAAFGEVYAGVVPEMPNPAAAPPLDLYRRIATTVADGMRDGFAAPEEWRYDWERCYTRDEWLDQVPTFGGHSLLSVDRRDALLAGIGAAIDAVGGRFAMHYTTLTVAAVRE